MKIAVFGLGYVGCVNAVGLTLMGHEVWGVDKDPAKVKWMAKGIAPINEPGFPNQLRAALDTGRLSILADAGMTISNTQVALICVGTPTAESGATFLGFIERVVEEIDRALSAQPHPYTIVVRSTIPPGTMDGCILPILYRSRVPSRRYRD
jgi:GDP-mannose 6-dehydrogenase